MRWVLLCLSMAGTAQAESVVATRMITAETVLAPEDLALVEAMIPGAVKDPSLAIGQSVRRAILPGRPVLSQDLAAPIRVNRNTRVEMRFHTGGLVITAEGRALDKGAVGATIRVLALSSKSVVEGRVGPDGSIWVGAK